LPNVVVAPHPQTHAHAHGVADESGEFVDDADVEEVEEVDEADVVETGAHEPPHSTNGHPRKK